MVVHFSATPKGQKGNLVREGSQISSESLMRNEPPHSRGGGGGEEAAFMKSSQGVGGVVCCKIVILWLGCHGNSMGWVSHVPLLCVISVAAGRCAQGYRR